MDGVMLRRRERALGRQVSAWVTLAALAASVLTSSRVDIVLLVMAGMAAAYTIGRWVEAQRDAFEAARGHDITHLLGAALVRCRRWSRPLTLVRIAGPLDAATRAIVSEAVRGTDEVCHEEDATYVIMPEESVIGVTTWARRLVLAVELPALAIAQFPVDGLTVDGLLAHAQSSDAELSQPLPAPPLPPVETGLDEDGRIERASGAPRIGDERR